MDGFSPTASQSSSGRGALTSLLVDGWLLVDVGIWAGGLCGQGARADEKDMLMVGETGSLRKRAQMGWEKARKLRGSCPEPRQNRSFWSCPSRGCFHTFLVGWEQRHNRAHHFGEFCLWSWQEGVWPFWSEPIPQKVGGLRIRSLGACRKKRSLGKGAPPHHKNLPGWWKWGSGVRGVPVVLGAEA